MQDISSILVEKNAQTTTSKENSNFSFIKHIALLILENDAIKISNYHLELNFTTSVVSIYYS